MAAQELLTGEHLILTMSLNLKEKVYGFIFGGAIGDALGLGTEFMSVAEVRRRYPAGLQSYHQIVQDAHRSQWDRGDWTNNTEVLLRLIESIIDKGDIDIHDFARVLVDWFITNPVDVVPQVRCVVSQPDYLDDPIGVALRMWEKMGHHNASNEALQRAILCGAWEKDNPEKRVADVCRITHPDTRCSCAASILAHISHSLIYEDRLLSRDEIMAIANRIDRRVAPYIEAADNPDISTLKLDDRQTLWYVRKCMACALWALRHTDNPSNALDAIVMAGGDADTNGAVAMNLVGMRDGYSALPPTLIQGLLQRERLDDIAARFYPIFEKRVNG